MKRKVIYKCVIIDDEPAAQMVLKSHIAKESSLELVAQCYNALELTDYLKENEVDLLFFRYTYARSKWHTIFRA